MLVVLAFLLSKNVHLEEKLTFLKTSYQNMTFYIPHKLTILGLAQIYLEHMSTVNTKT